MFITTTHQDYTDDCARRYFCKSSAAHPDLGMDSCAVTAFFPNTVASGIIEFTPGTDRDIAPEYDSYSYDVRCYLTTDLNIGASKTFNFNLIDQCSTVELTMTESSETSTYYVTHSPDLLLQWDLDYLIDASIYYLEL